MLSILQRFFGSPSKRILKKLQPQVDEINKICEQLAFLSHDELREETNQLRAQIKHDTAQEYDKLMQVQKEAEACDGITQKANLFSQLDSLQEDYEKKIATILDKLVPQAFAIVKETTRRFKDNSTLAVQATAYDKLLAKNCDYIKIVDEKAFWKNSWQAGGQTITWTMVPYDVQLMGGIVLHQGKIAEMATGEGKTLVAILPAFLNALAGKGVHLATVNNYLSVRDAEWVGPIHQFHGISIDCIDKYPSHSVARKQAYLADITYGTNNEFGFDYLRDNMVTNLAEKVQRGHYYAIVDEVDSGLIDQARTPLIISGPASYDDTPAYYRFKSRVEQLYQIQRQLITNLLQEAKTKTKEKNTKEAGLALFRIYRGLPKYGPFIQYLSEPGMKKLLADTESIYIEENNRKMPEADEPLFFIIDEKENIVELTEKGANYLRQHNEDPNFFLLPDMAAGTAAIEQNEALTDEEKIQERALLNKNYSEKSTRIHTVQQLLKAYTLFERDIDYVVINQQVKIVDEKTGRILSGRRYSDGLHQALEAKEQVSVQESTQTYATITPQNQFRMYKKLAGMTGTAETEATELWDIYKLAVIVIPTHKPVVRKDKEDKIYKTHEEKLDAIKQEVHELHEQGRPILVGTSSVESSEQMGKKLKLSARQVLNARNHKIESQIIAQAGQKGAITVVTHMAGRGTDIKLSPAAKEAGGLAIIGAERHENRRVDRQLRGRSGRQGDPGSSQFFISLEDPLMAHFRHGFIGSQMDKIFHQKGEAIQDSRITRAIQTAQKRLEENHFSYRKRSLEYDDVMNMQRKVIYQKRNHALYRDRLELDIMHMLHHTLSQIINQAKAADTTYKSFLLDFMGIFNLQPPISEKQFKEENAKKLIKQLYETLYTTYLTRKEEAIKAIDTLFKNKPIETLPNSTLHFTIDLHQENIIQTAIDLSKDRLEPSQAILQQIESNVVLSCIDKHWKHHLQRMDELKEATSNAIYEQKDPLIIYKFEGLELFKQLIHTIHKETINQLFSLQDINLATGKSNNSMQQATENLQEHTSYDQTPHDSTHAKKEINQPIKTTKKYTRNQRITVRYPDGTIKENIKFKDVADDIEKRSCTVVENTNA